MVPELALVEVKGVHAETMFSLQKRVLTSELESDLQWLLRKGHRNIQPSNGFVEIKHIN